MNQFEFSVTNKRTGGKDHIRATAKSEIVARAHILSYYGQQFDVASHACAVRQAHAVLGEIDCTGGDDVFDAALVAQYC